jgi:hypothetical protein
MTNSTQVRANIVSSLTAIFAQESALTDLDRALTAKEMDRVDALGEQALALGYTNDEYIAAKRMNYTQLRAKLDVRCGSYRERTRLVADRHQWS